MKSERIYIRLTKEQKKQIEEDSSKLGLSVSAYLIMLWHEFRDFRD